MNFLKETISAIKRSGHKVEDVDRVCSRDGRYFCTWESFEANADFEYNNGYGTNVIPIDLIIMFTDQHYLYRCEYDGDEWWEHTERIETVNAPIKIVKFTGRNLTEAHRTNNEIYR